MVDLTPNFEVADSEQERPRRHLHQERDEKRGRTYATLVWGVGSCGVFNATLVCEHSSRISKRAGEFNVALVCVHSSRGVQCHISL